MEFLYSHSWEWGESIKNKNKNTKKELFYMKLFSCKNIKMLVQYQLILDSILGFGKTQWKKMKMAMLSLRKLNINQYAIWFQVGTCTKNKNWKEKIGAKWKSDNTPPESPTKRVPGRRRQNAVMERNIMWTQWGYVRLSYCLHPWEDLTYVAFPTKCLSQRTANYWNVRKKAYHEWSCTQN